MKYRSLSRSLVQLSSFLLLSSAIVSTAEAQNAAWPNRAITNVEELRDPANWPDDPGYGYDVRGDGTTCIEGGRCWNNENGGQWNMWSWAPREAEAREGWRSEESALGAGTWTDMAWTVTTGDPGVVIAVLDSGINWDERDLVNQYHINRAELEVAGLDPDCLPTTPAGHTGDPVDLNGDGTLSMRDWYVGLSDAEATTLSERIDAKGNNNGVAEPGDLITFCSDDVDDDGNGYADDISGWDFYQNDNDPNDDTRFGHGTGEARWSAAEANNGQGRAGFCPSCRILMVRVGDSFIADVQDYAQGVVFSTDSGAAVIQEALGTINHTTFMRRATDYAYDNGVLIIASAADENSYHHNMPGTANHTLYIHAIRYAGPQPQTSTSFLAFNNCTNYGAQLAASAPGTGCSSEATGVGAGIAGLVISASRDADRAGGPLDPPLSAEELRQVMLMETDDIWVAESDPDHPDYNSEWYSSSEGWDQRFGWGRINTYKSILAVNEGRIPPEVDIVGPDWFRNLYPARDGSVAIRGTIDARRAENFDYVIEWAPGIEPTNEEFTTIAMGSGLTERLDGDLTTWDIATLDVDNGDEGGIHNRYTATVRIRVTAHYGGEIGDVIGEQRRAYNIVPEDGLLPAFPIALGTVDASDEFQAASGESSPKLADLDGDGDVEIVFGDADGLLHVFQDDGTELAGFPVQLGTLRGQTEMAPDGIAGSAAYASGDIPTADLASSIMAAAAIGDIDGDGSLNIVVATMEGEVYVLNPDGTSLAGFPVGLPDVLSADTRRGGPANEDSIVERGIFASPALADLDGDDLMEIVIAGFDGQLHVFRADGSIQPGFPVEVVAPVLWVNVEEAQPSRIMTSPAIGDADGDGILDISVGSNEYGSSPNSGAIHLLHGDGNLHDGGPEHDNWPIKIVSLELFPMVGRGTTSPIIMADVDGDDMVELGVTGTASRMAIYDGIQPEREPGESAQPLFVMASGNRGPLTDITDPLDSPLFSTFAGAAFHDLTQDGIPEYVTAGAGLGLAANLAGGYQNKPFSHMMGAWTVSETPGATSWGMMPGFPRRIEDYLFFVNPTSADVSGDGYPEIIAGSGGYWIHAWDGCGREAPGFPKFVGGWVISSVASGDVDGDGLLEIVVATRSGYLYVFDTEGQADGSIGWPEFRHDNQNTGNYETELPFGSPVTAATPLECEIPAGPDAGPGAGDASVDAMAGDAGAGGDAGADADMGGGPSGGGCNCRIGEGSTDTPLFAGIFLVLGMLWRRRGR
ncbi:MAG: S8 family serine peptidase [Polyangiales bacterium]